MRREAVRGIALVNRFINEAFGQGKFNSVKEAHRIAERMRAEHPREWVAYLDHHQVVDCDAEDHLTPIVARLKRQQAGHLAHEGRRKAIERAVEDRLHGRDAPVKMNAAMEQALAVAKDRVRRQR
jgi:hypothetical protein